MQKQCQIVRKLNLPENLYLSEQNQTENPCQIVGFTTNSRLLLDG